MERTNDLTARAYTSPLPSSAAGTPAPWVREPLYIGIAMVCVLGIALPALGRLPYLPILGLVQLVGLFVALRIANPADETFRLSMHISQAGAFAATAFTVFGLGYPGAMILYYAPPVLLCNAHLLGAKSAAWWTAPWLFLVVASEFAKTPGSPQPTGGEIIFVEACILLASTAFATSLRRTYDKKCKELEHLATTDPLTGLGNRREFMQMAATAIDRAQRFERRGAVLFLDIDGLKQVNDQHGHLAGDTLIREVAHRLAANVRSIDMAARVGGDEFVILLSEYEDAKGAEVFARKLSNIVSRRLEGIDIPILPRASIGIAEFPVAGHDLDTIMQRADDAMYNAKSEGGDRIYKANREGAAEVF